MDEHREARAGTTELGAYFLARLERLVQLRQAWRRQVDSVPPELLEFALASTYADCVSLGLRLQAEQRCGSGHGLDEDCRGIR
jgi:hypothetical protein